MDASPSSLITLGSRVTVELVASSGEAERVEFTLVTSKQAALRSGLLDEAAPFGRLQRGPTQAQLAEMVGTRQPSIARLENGTSVPSLSFLDRIATALDARIELHIVPQD